MANFVQMEMQVLAGILPISRVSAIPSCIHYIGNLLPLEKIFKLTHPSLANLPVEDKRTWRTGIPLSHVGDKGRSIEWTAMDILTSYADKKGWVTAKAGRSDIMRAGNALLRALAEGKVAWGFWPPGVDLSQIKRDGADSCGIWIPRAEELDEDIEESETEVEMNKVMVDTSEEWEDDKEAVKEKEWRGDSKIASNWGRFAALSCE
jgi:hypothetical protein